MMPQEVVLLRCTTLIHMMLCMKRQWQQGQGCAHWKKGWRQQQRPQKTQGQGYVHWKKEQQQQQQRQRQQQMRHLKQHT